MRGGPGQYLVLWHNVSGDDGDPNDGSFVFTVAGASPQAATAPAAPNPAPATTNPQPVPPPTTAAKPVTCVNHGVITPGIADFRVNTYRNRQAIRDQYKGKINELLFNYDLSIGMGLESSLKTLWAEAANRWERILLRVIQTQTRPPATGAIQLESSKSERYAFYTERSARVRRRAYAEPSRATTAKTSLQPPCGLHRRPNVFAVLHEVRHHW